MRNSLNHGDTGSIVAPPNHNHDHEDGYERQQERWFDPESVRESCSSYGGAGNSGHSNGVMDAYSPRIAIGERR